MKMISISDITLREFVPNKDYSLSFREKLEIAKTLEKLNINKIELPPIRDTRADMLTNRTIATGVSGCTISATVGFTEQSVEDAWNSIRDARSPSLHVMVPVSPIQMEYVCNKKADAVLEMIGELVTACKARCAQVEFSAVDATRAEDDFLCRAIETAIGAGATQITLCDSAGEVTANEFAGFLTGLCKSVPELANVTLGAQVSDNLKLAVACACAAIENGVTEIKTTVGETIYAKLEDVVHFVQVKGAALGIGVDIKTASLNRSSKQLCWILQSKRSEQSPLSDGTGDDNAASSNISIDKNDDISEVVKVINLLGYSLSDEDNIKVFEAVKLAAEKKQFVKTRELEAIIASTALQVPSAYHIDNYVITSGNNIAAMASITLEKNGGKLQGLSTGDGPIDASFLAIEQIVGRHYELDDFQIQAVTEGREAMGSALVKLRSGGRLYSGTGISTDINGASIRAYINALNKIVYEEG